MLRELRQQDDSKIVVRYVRKSDWLKYIDGNVNLPPTFPEYVMIKMFGEDWRKDFHRLVVGMHVSEG